MQPRRRLGVGVEVEGLSVGVGSDSGVCDHDKHAGVGAVVEVRGCGGGDCRAGALLVSASASTVASAALSTTSAVASTALVVAAMVLVG